MTTNDFRKLALSFPEAIESAHMRHPDFRVGGKIFATLGYPGKEWAVVKLTPDEQKRFMQRDPRIFQPVKGAWGRRGTQTSICLRRRSTSCGRLSQRRGGTPHRNDWLRLFSASQRPRERVPLLDWQARSRALRLARGRRRCTICHLESLPGVCASARNIPKVSRTVAS